MGKHQTYKILDSSVVVGALFIILAICQFTCSSQHVFKWASTETEFRSQLIHIPLTGGFPPCCASAWKVIRGNFTQMAIRCLASTWHVHEWWLLGLGSQWSATNQVLNMALRSDLWTTEAALYWIELLLFLCTTMCISLLCTPEHSCANRSLLLTTACHNLRIH